jgi:glucokinase
MSTQKYAISLDVGGTFTKAAVVDRTGGQCLFKAALATRTDLPSPQVPDYLVEQIRALMADAEVATGDVAGISIGLPGVINQRTGRAISCPNLRNWEDLPLADQVAQRIGLPTWMEKDANQAALGELWLGAARQIEHSICFTLGTGIGTGIILNGQLYRGGMGGAGEIGHLPILPNGPQCGCGNHGCLEALASASAVSREARAAVEQDSQSAMVALAGGQAEAITSEIVFAAARAGDATAQCVLDTALEYLGIGIASIINAFNPDLIVLGGGMAQAGEQLLSPIRNVVGQHARRPLAEHVNIVLTELGSMAGVLGGAYLVFSHADR